MRSMRVGCRHGGGNPKPAGSHKSSIHAIFRRIEANEGWNPTISSVHRGAGFRDAGLTGHMTYLNGSKSYSYGELRQ